MFSTIRNWLFPVDNSAADREYQMLLLQDRMRWEKSDHPPGETYEGYERRVRPVLGFDVESLNYGREIQITEYRNSEFYRCETFSEFMMERDKMLKDRYTFACAIGRTWEAKQALN